MSEEGMPSFEPMTLNLSAEEAQRLYQDIIHMDEEWAVEEPYASIREKMESQI